MIPALLAFSAACALATLPASRWAPRWWTALTLAWLAGLLAASIAVLSGGGPWDWRAAWGAGGEAIHLQFDALSAFFAALLAVVGGAATVYSRAYWPDVDHPRSAATGRFWWSVLLGSLAMVLVQSNGLHFLIAWELFTLAAYFLVTLDRRSREVREAGWLYLAASHVGTLLLFAFFALLAARVGGWDLGPLRDRADLAPLFWLALAGFGIKSGMFPLHVWLPSAHASAPSHVSAILSGVTIKIGIYALVRFSGWLPVPEAAAWTVVVAGLASAVLGVAFALGQHDLKRLLAYHSVENIGIILIGLGFAMVASAHGETWGRLAMAGGLLHVWNHGLFKSLLFLGAGSVLHSTGTRQMSRLGGLWRTMPWTAGCFALGAAAISGLPPLNGFVSEWLIFLGLFDAATARGPVSLAALPGAVLLGITGAMALACFVKVCGVVFLGLPRTPSAARAHECGWAMRGPMLALGAACVAIGLAPVLFYGPVARAASAWNPAYTPAPAPAPLLALGLWHLALAGIAMAAAAALWARVRRNGLRRAVTWDCGYAAPAPSMQYTAGSFAAIVTRWFAWILRPARHVRAPVGAFPAHASHAVHTPETVLEKWIGPVASGVMALSAAVLRLQHGRVQAYLFYLVVGIALVTLVALAGGAR
jgi:hydrogenase-4 component B